jgi:type IV pilus assembly protein PilC
MAKSKRPAQVEQKPPQGAGLSRVVLLSRRLPTGALIELCRVLRHYLNAGLMLRDVFRQQARSGPAAARPVAARISTAIEQGDDLQEALKREEGVFPILFVSMVSVAEHTGMLPEVFQDLERYFTRQQKLRRDFISRITWPIIQLVLGVLVVAMMVLILGLIAEARPGEKPLDPLGLGLYGPRGAMIILGTAAGIATSIAVAYFVITRVMRKQSVLDTILLRQPVIGPCMQALAMARFCLALKLTSETGMSIGKALDLSLKATSNGAFEGASKGIVYSVSQGIDLTTALAASGVFPTEFVHIMEVAEESGEVTNVMRRQAEHYDEEAGRRLAILASTAAYGVWTVVGGLMVWTIYRIFTMYVSKLTTGI